MKYVDRFINSITMYQLTLQGLFIVVFWSMALSLFGLIPYSLLSLVASFFVLTVVSYTSNAAMGRLLKLPVNAESSSITALILFLILPPVASLHDAGVVAFAALAAMVTKYFFVFRRKHIFNPAAAGAVVMTMLFGVGATWWAGSLYMLPLVFALGFLMTRKIHRFTMVGMFLAVALGGSIAVALHAGTTLSTADSLGQLMYDMIVSGPLVFFGFIMLTEPLTTPPTRTLQVAYAALVGALFAAPFHLGPEVALLVGNVFSALVTPNPRLLLRLREAIKTTPDTYHFVFNSPQRLRFVAGQYMEWTLTHDKADARGMRRYFTVASAPTEDTIAIGVKIGEKASSFKQALLRLKPGDVVGASSLAGDFTLPKDTGRKLAFIAGGIGITPFRSMIKQLVDTGERRDIVLLYAALSPADFAYGELWNAASYSVGLKTVYVATDKDRCPPDWDGCTGYITEAMLQKEVPDYADRTFYISGPGAMVEAYTALLVKLGISKNRIITDYFPGF